MGRIVFLITALLFMEPLAGQKNARVSYNADAKKDSIVFSQMRYRLVGPWRGGRSAAVAASYENRKIFYFGGTGGGVWKTQDGGASWKNISDGFFGGSIGAVAVAPSDESVIYVGEGENTMRGNVSEGLGGVWRSDDGGRNWRNVGLGEGRHIIRLVIHPRNPDIVWAAAMGHLFGPNTERGVFKTTDGGKTWRKTLYINDQTGCSDLVMEPGNPSVFYAGTWRLIRTPHSLESGGEGSGLWKSTDGGETWQNITGSKGLPRGAWGIVGVAVAPSNPNRIYSLVENRDGGLYMSDDAGITWTLQSSDNNIRQRAWYYTKVFVDPRDENKVYCPNVNFMVSSDAGRTFKSINTPHGDHHDLWIDPEDPARMIVADDGGAQVSFDGGNTWSTYMNQPTAQLYRVSTDNAFPYRILAAQQDNSTLRIRSRTYGRAITARDWEPTAGSESGYVVADPRNPDIVYGGNYGGYLSRLDHKTGENRTVSVWPDNPMGAGADVLKYRFQWNFPIFFSPHTPGRLYAAGNHLFVTEDEGQSWKQISPDLTTNDKSKQGSSGGLITQDNTSVEYYCTIFTAIESPYEKDLLWTGSDDGLVHVSRDGGVHWENVTPAGIPRWMMWNCIEADPFKKGAAYIAGTRYKSDDFSPYIYKTEDYGKSWKRIVTGIPPRHFTRALRADRKVPGLLYAGTEYGMYYSEDDGKSWKPFQLNLPLTPITDLAIHENDLVVATQGRSLWVLDDLSVVQAKAGFDASRPLYVFDISPAYRMRVSGGSSTAPGDAGANPPAGAVIKFHLPAVTDSTRVSVSILDHERKLIRTYRSDAKDAGEKIAFTQGMNQWAWNLQYPGGERLDNMVLWNGVPGNILAAPGTYYARIKVDRDSVEKSITVRPDPNYPLTDAQYREQFDFLISVRDKFNESQATVKDIRTMRAQIQDFMSRQDREAAKEVKTLADSVQRQLTRIEETIHQTRAKSSQDVLNYPIRLNDKLSGLFDAANSGINPPSKQVREVYAELAKQVDAAIADFRSLQSNEIMQLNRLIREKELPVIGVKKSTGE
jgi:photosystem II stability/assembly factor-like uncharacterized protein